MEKKIYVQPLTEQTVVNADKIMIVASPGIGGDYDPDIPIDAKGNDFLEDENALFRNRNLWDD